MITSYGAKKLEVVSENKDTAIEINTPNNMLLAKVISDK